MIEKKWTTMATIARTHERAVHEGLGVSRNLIRELAITETIPTVLVGKNTRLINWDVFVNFLRNGSPQQREQPGQIRKINV